MRWACVCLVAAASCATLTPSRVHQHETPRLLNELNSEDSWIREEAARALGAKRAAEARSALEARVADPSERTWVRAAAAQALGALADPAAVPVLAGAAAAPASPAELKLALIEALCHFPGVPAAFEILRELRLDTDLLVSGAAERRVTTRCGA